jgi:hypothetical protein
MTAGSRVPAGSERARTPTEEALLQMLTENTGTHFLDSGGDSGRHWQRNGGRDFENEEPSTLSFRYDSIELTHRVFHWLRDRLEFDESANAAFDGPFRDEVDPDGEKAWEELRDDFADWYAAHRSRIDSSSPCYQCDGDGCDDCTGTGTIAGSDDLYEATGIYGDGSPITINTYNEENLLDQTLLFTYFELRTGPGRGGNEGSFIVLQIHGGCDVRGGYTRPRIFQITSDEQTDIFDYRRGTISCAGDGEEGEAHWWTTDDGSHWYAEGASGRGAGVQLERHERRELDAKDGQWQRGVLCVLADGTGLCPLCGARLAGGQ